ncbi:DinB family protein [Ornithinimicrobium panacihumi]|uniref:DinB family protein n=1 Tax=Ornithinimicrobium panacihumi TaxID=2008449 RepID=UPI003F89E3A2
MSREHPAGTGAEREVLTGFLDWQRDTVRLKTQGLGRKDADRALLPTSPRMTIAGVLSHLRQTEHEWFAGSFPSRAGAVHRDPRGGWDPGGVPVEELLSRYEAACQNSRDIVAGLPLDQMQEFTPDRFTPVNLRWILTHMIEETARHLGHLHILREQLDGSRGY